MSMSSLLNNENISHTQQKLLDDLNAIRLSKRFSDLTFIVNGKSFPVHSAIVGFRCPELISISDTASISSKQSAKPTKNKSMKPEEPVSVINLPNMDEEVATELLRYLYTGKIEGIQVLAKKLLPVAVLYKLDEMRDMCEKALTSDLNMNNSIDHLIFADINRSCITLRQKSLDFIIENIKNIIDTANFHNLSKEYPDLLEEIIRHLVKHYVPDEPAVVNGDVHF